MTNYCCMMYEERCEAENPVNILKIQLIIRRLGKYVNICINNKSSDSSRVDAVSIMYIQHIPNFLIIEHKVPAINDDKASRKN